MAIHGGQSFDAIGADLSTPERGREVITADVLDAWFEPTPGVIDRLARNLPFLVRNSPPLCPDGLAAGIAASPGL